MGNKTFETAEWVAMKSMLNEEKKLREQMGYAKEAAGVHHYAESAVKGMLNEEKKLKEQMGYAKEAAGVHHYAESATMNMDEQIWRAKGMTGVESAAIKCNYDYEIAHKAKGFSGIEAAYRHYAQSAAIKHGFNDEIKGFSAIEAPDERFYLGSDAITDSFLPPIIPMIQEFEPPTTPTIVVNELLEQIAKLNQNLDALKPTFQKEPASPDKTLRDDNQLRMPTDESKRKIFGRDEKAEIEKPEVRVFIAYAEDDRKTAKRICEFLKTKNIGVWIDYESIHPGQIREYAIRKAVKESDYCLILLSSDAVSKRGVFHKELKIAKDAAAEIPRKDIFMIPIRINVCELPEEIEGLHHVDLFPSSDDALNDDALNKVLRVLCSDKKFDNF